MQPSPSWSGGWNRRHDEWIGWPQQSLELSGRRATETLWQIYCVMQIFLRTAWTIHWIVGIMHLSLCKPLFLDSFLKLKTYLETVCIPIAYISEGEVCEPIDYPGEEETIGGTYYWWRMVCWIGAEVRPEMVPALSLGTSVILYMFWFQKIKLNSTFYKKHRAPFETCIKSRHQFNFFYVVLCWPYRYDRSS